MTPERSLTRGLDQRHRGDLAAGEHDVAERHLGQSARRDDALVDALEAPAENGDARPRGELADEALRRRLAARAHQEPRARIGQGPGRVDRGGGDVATDHHAGPASGRRVVDAAMAPDAVLADIGGVERPDALAQAPRPRANARAGPETSPGKASGPRRASSCEATRQPGGNTPSRSLMTLSAKACAQGTMVSTSRNSSGVCALPPTGPTEHKVGQPCAAV